MAGPKVPIVMNYGKTIFSRSLSLLLRNSQSTTISKFRTFSTASSEGEEERDPAPYFFNKKVQSLLKSITGRDYEIIFRQRKDSRKLAAPKYKFMTDEELKESMIEAEYRADKILKIPPVLKKREEITTVVSEDPALQGNETCKFVFTDITFGKQNHERIIVVREPDGTLRHANWDERHRMNQIYFPMEGREMYMPEMFSNPYLENLLERKEYIFILDRACIQMDPDDPKFIEVSKSVYESINTNNDYDLLKSTRHYGSMVFYLAWDKNMSKLFLYNIKNERIEENVSLIHLYCKLHPDEKYKNLKYEDDDVKFVEEFVNIEFTKTNIVPALEAYKELIEERKKVKKNIEKAHGYN